MRGHLASISEALRNLSLFTFVTGDFVSHKDPRVSNVRSSSSQSTLTAARAILALCLTLTPCLEIELSVTHCSLATALCPFIAGCHGPQGGGWSPHIMGHGGCLVMVSVVSSGPCHHPPSCVRMTSGIG